MHFFLGDLTDTLAQKDSLPNINTFRGELTDASAEFHALRADAGGEKTATSSKAFF